MNSNDLIKEIHKVVCMKMYVDYKHTFSMSRKERLVLARQVTMSLARKHLKLSFESIAEFFKQDFSSAMHANKQVMRLYFSDAEFMAEYDDIDIKIGMLTEGMKKDFKRELKTIIKDYVNEKKHKEISQLIDIL